MFVHVSRQAFSAEVNSFEIFLKRHMFWHLFYIVPVGWQAHHLKDLFELIVMIWIRRFDVFLATVENRL